MEAVEAGGCGGAGGAGGAGGSGGSGGSGGAGAGAERADTPNIPITLLLIVTDDCNENGVWDLIDLANGVLTDFNKSGARE